MAAKKVVHKTSKGKVVMLKPASKKVKVVALSNLKAMC